MRKPVSAVAAAVVAICPALPLATPVGVAHASPHTLATDHSPQCPDFYWIGYQGLCWPDPAHSPPPASIAECARNNGGIKCAGPVPPTAAAPTTTPARAPSSSPTGAPNTTPAQAPNSPPTTGAPRNAGLLPPPKGLDAPPEAVSAAKNAPATRVDPANPPKPLTHGDFHQQIKDAVDAHPRNVDVVSVNNQALVRPRHWEYLDYDVYHRPRLYNPLTEAMTFRYFYGGAYREASVAAGGAIVLDVATVGVFPFTAVSDSYVASASFTGGAWVPPAGWDGPPPPTYTPPAPPTVYHDVPAYVPAENQTVQVGQVTPVGHDDSQPAGSQDTFLIDDSTLAWGQVTDPNNGQLTVTKTQSLPGVGPTDDGGVLVALAAHPQSSSNWWAWALGGVGLVVAAGLIAWMMMRRNRTPTTGDR